MLTRHLEKNSLRILENAYEHKRGTFRAKPPGGSLSEWIHPAGVLSEKSGASENKTERSSKKPDFVEDHE
jgi:hypothetical protein